MKRRIIAMVPYLGLLAIFAGCVSDSIPAPVTIAPSDSAIIDTNPPEFVWENVPEADLYRLQVSHTRDFTNIVCNVPCTGDTTYTPTTVFEPGTYYWRVCGEVGG